MRLRPVSLLALAAWLSVSLAGRSSGADASRSVTCSFSNPGYSGWCRQSETVPNGKSAAGVCREILQCLNDTRCTRTYCSASGVRGNWKLERVVPRTRPPAAKSASLGGGTLKS